MARTYEINLVNLVEKFNSEERCRAYLEELRWPDGVRCPRCDSDKVSRLHDRDQYDCDSCRYQFSVTSGTIMHDTHLPLWKWFLAVYMMVESKKSVSANQLRRSLHVAPKTAWHLCHRIRSALQTPAALLAGIVEIDETYIGPRKPRHKGTSKRGRGTSKQMVVGAVQRKGAISMQTANKADRKTLRQFILENVADEAGFIYTDDNPAYGNLSDENTKHETVNHSHGEYVRGDVHTNSIEGGWSLFKRCIVGAYHKISVKHLDSYLDEFEFRFNNRNNPFIFRDAMRELLTATPLQYKELVA
jgi:transposase-like protein